MDRHGASQERVDGCNKRRSRGATDTDLGLGRVAAQIPLHRLAQAGSGGIELADGIVLLGPARRREGREDEVRRREAEKQRDGQGGGVGRLVGRRKGRDSREVEDEDAREDEAQGEDEEDGVDCAGEGGGVDLHAHIDEVAVVQAGAGVVHGGEGAEEEEGDGGRGDVDDERGDGGRGLQVVEGREEVQLRVTLLACSKRGVGRR